MPAWNPLAPAGQRKGMVTDSLPMCIGLTNMKANLKCAYSSTHNTLLITELDMKTPGDILKFQLHQVRNPYNARPMKGFKITTLNAESNAINESEEFEFSCTDPAEME